MKHKMIISLLLCGLGGMQYAQAQESAFQTSGVIMGLSNYLWRGLTISDDKPSLQADIMLEHETGFYAGVSFETYRYQGDEGIEKDYEIDYYAGYYLTVSDELGFGFNAMRYTYGDSHSNLEYALSMDYNSLNLALNYDQDFETWYSEANYALPLAQYGELVIHGGYYFDAETMGFEDKGELQDSAYDLALRYSYPLLSQLDLLLEASYQEFEHDHYMIGLAFNF
ncbi:TorF family putative porin [Shewanella algae]|uniref:TorF family putative porin n=1 Tax=Shewanella algae TaxID=38313 RepID=UPI0005ED3C57|nr:TorF family putative porin [Shewanella algae]MBO2549809.1 hypothetical protein [Shewanella algae]MBO2555163.1 hypothetical protein [Shewanella algae]MBO2567877.1 hypothetical protein [Shewanella algae]MBO2572097.1 hypothetical protein [Shewanella algae]MBO2576478.1 hypothetical protein [Shewanella algae]